jgi:hypothetical protein
MGENVNRHFQAIKNQQSEISNPASTISIFHLSLTGFPEKCQQAVIDSVFSP